MKPKNLLMTLLILTLFLPAAGFAQKANVPRQQDTVAMAIEKVKELLLMMNPDKNNKVSKQEWMKFMETEFDRLDTDKKGEIDLKKLQEQMAHASGRGATGR